MYILAPFSLGNSVHIQYISQYSIYIISCILIIIDGQDHLFLQNIHQCLSDNMYVHSDLSVFGLYCPIQTVP